jgi:mono/diheme cytochrome c family protein
MSEIDSKVKAVARENPEPEEGRNPWPFAVWLFFGIMIGWGVTYLAFQAGDGSIHGGDLRTALVNKSGSALAIVKKVDGGLVFKNVCAACHQQTGEGIPGAFPPLAGSEWVNGDPDIAAKIVLFGLQGPIDVKGNTYNGAMPAFGSTLGDTEIASVVSYIRNTWGNAGSELVTDEVTKLRELHKTRSTPWTSAELKAVQ